MINRKTYHKLTDAIDAISIDWMVADTTPQQKELDRQAYQKEWGNVCEAHGVTIEELDFAIEARCIIALEHPTPKRFDEHLGSTRSPKWGCFMPDGRQAYTDDLNVMAWRRKKDVQEWIDNGFDDPFGGSAVTWKM